MERLHQGEEMLERKIVTLYPRILFFYWICHFLFPSSYTHVDIRRFAMVSTGWNRASSAKPATADPMILAFPLPPEDWTGLEAMTGEVDLSSLRVIVMQSGAFNSRDV